MTARMTFFQRWFTVQPVRIEDVFSEDEVIDVHTFRGQERMDRWATLNDQERYSAVVRGSVLRWPRRSRWVA